MNDPVTLTDDERDDLLHADENVACAVERIVAARVAQVTAERDYWVQQATDRIEGFAEFQRERDALAAKVERVEALADKWDALASLCGHERISQRPRIDLRVALDGAA